jgi:aryl-alcohol dehydrogenase-like predicted oxidoreductase
VKYSTVAGLDRQISRLVLGSTMFDSEHPSRSFPMLDHFRDSGGNCVDTAAVYGHGAGERAVGAWLTGRGNRDDIVLIGKGACTTACTPDLVTTELHESLQRLRTDHVDIYMMHRDNPAVPAGQFVERLNKHLRAGDIRAFGGSNWSPQRIAEANAYAAEHDLAGFTASSPQFSLGRWNEPPWPGCITATDPATRHWYERSGLALFAWSSQAAGFFTGRYCPAHRTNPGLTDTARFWFNDDNFRRLDRVRKLAAQKGVAPAQVALAYVLCQPEHVFAVAGPLTLGELRDSVAAADLTLTADELRHLNLEDAGDGTPVSSQS